MIDLLALRHRRRCGLRNSPDRKGEHPRRHLCDFKGVLQADGYAGFDRLYNEADLNHPIQEAACWAHARRKFYDIQVATGSPVASEALARIGELYAIEGEIRGQLAEVRERVRQARAGPKLNDCTDGSSRRSNNYPKVRT